MKAYWTIGGDFFFTDDEGEPLVSVTFHEPLLRTEVIDEPQRVVSRLLSVLAMTPHPYAREEGDGVEIGPRREVE